MNNINHRNFSILLSVLMGSFVLTILFYIYGNQLYGSYENARQSMPEDLYIHDLINQQDLERFKKVSEIDKIGLSKEPYSLRKGEEAFYAQGYNEAYFSMQKNFLEQGRYPKEDNEILISNKTAKEKGWTIGQIISFQRGKRLLNGQSVDPTMGYNTRETFVESGEQQLKITGIYKMKTVFGTQAIYYAMSKSQPPYYAHLKIRPLKDIYSVQIQLKELFPEKHWGENQLICNDGILRFFGIEEGGRSLVRTLGLMLSYLMPIFIVTVTFILMVKNIFNIWALYKIKELSMYKSIGATNFQIWKLLWKEGLKISILPMILGMGLGLAAFRLNSLRLLASLSRIYDDMNADISLQWPIIFGIALILIFTISITIFFPARIVSKIEILDGIKGNIQLKEYGKKPKKHLWRELQFNNRKLMRSQYVILTAGLTFLGFLIGTEGIDRYNEDYSATEKTSYNLMVRYNRKDLSYPHLFEELKRELQPEKSMLSIRKQMYVEQDSLPFSKEFQSIGYNPKFSRAYFYPKNGMVGGELIGVEPEYLKKRGFSPQDMVLVNLVQKDLQQAYRKADFIPYLSSNLKEINIRYLESYPSHVWKVNQQTKERDPELRQLQNYDIRLLCSIDHWITLMQEAKEDFQAHNASLPTLYYEWQVQVPTHQLEEKKSQVLAYMQKHLKANEKYQIILPTKREQAKEMSDFSVYLLGIVLLLGIIGMNIANAYSVSRLYTFRRQKEIGTLLSNGMEERELQQQLKKEMRIKILLSAALSLVITYIILMAILYWIPYVRLISYFAILRYDLWVGILIVLCGLSYGIFNRSLTLLLQKSILELIQSE